MEKGQRPASGYICEVFGCNHRNVYLSGRVALDIRASQIYLEIIQEDVVTIPSLSLYF